MTILFNGKGVIMVIDRITELLAEQLNVDKATLNPDTRIVEDLHADSLDVVEMLIALEDEFGIRKLTPYECLALLGFPKDYKFPKIPLDNAYKQCGNSVVVPVIRRIAEEIMKVL